MRTWTSLILLSLLSLTGCAHHYVMRLSNGMQVTTTSKPHLDKGMYHYKDARGKKMSMSAGRVVEITPASMAEEQQDRFKPTPMPHY